MRRVIVLIATAALTAASATAQPPAAAPPPHGGTIAIEPRTAEGDYDPSTRLFADATARALASKGFTIFDDPAHAAYVADLTLSRAEVGTDLAKDPHGAQASVGAGVIVPFGTGKSQLVLLERTRLDLRIRARNGSAVWRGAAVTVRAAGTRNGGNATVASDLSQAMLAPYPAEPRDPVGVP